MTTGLAGIDLKIDRLRAGVSVRDLAAAMGISSSRVSRIEAEPRVTERMLARYRAALGTCRTPAEAA